MEKNYAILRIKKYKSLSAVRSSERHGLERERVKHRVNEDKERQNKYKFNGIYSDCENLNQAYKKGYKKCQTHYSQGCGACNRACCNNV